MRSFYLCAHGGRVVETEQSVRIVDQHVEVLKEILAEDAANVGIYRAKVQQTVHKHLLVGQGMGTCFKHVEPGEGSRFMESSASDHGRARSVQMELDGQRRIDHGDLGPRIQEKVVGTEMVDGYSHDNLVAVYDAEGYPCDISRTMGFRQQCGDDGCCDYEGSEPLENCHRESSSAA